MEKVYSTSDGLSNSGLYSIFNYNDSLLFLTTNFGISVFNIKTEKFSNYFEEDGLQNNTFEEASRDTLNGIFYAGGADGFVKIIPQKIVADTHPPQLYFTKLLAEGSSDNFIDTSNLNANFFSIPSQSVQVKVFFSGIHYQNPERVLYAYKIKELGNYWINLNTQNFITLIGLSPKTYHLQVRAFNEDGVPSDIKELTLIFLPKWYQTWWFKTLIALTIISISYALYRMRINQLKKEQRIRTKLANDLHDDLGSTMNSVKVYANLAIMEKQADKYLPMIKEGSQEAITGIRDIIWVLDDKKNSLEQLLSRISSFASPLCEANHIQYKQELSDNARDHKLGQEEKRNLYMMLKEAVNNANKYSHAQTITIEVSVIKGKPLIQIKDDGKGFDAGKTTEGNGLKNMQRRAKEIKYNFRIESSQGNGTTIHFEKI
jgi:signal transduction histidine kinase